jgi:hypothetical protein
LPSMTTAQPSARFTAPTPSPCRLSSETNDKAAQLSCRAAEDVATHPDFPSEHPESAAHWQRANRKGQPMSSGLGQEKHVPDVLTQTPYASLASMERNCWTSLRRPQCIRSTLMNALNFHT